MQFSGWKSEKIKTSWPKVLALLNIHKILNNCYSQLYVYHWFDYFLIQLEYLQRVYYFGTKIYKKNMTYIYLHSGQTHLRGSILKFVLFISVYGPMDTLDLLIYQKN